MRYLLDTNIILLRVRNNSYVKQFIVGQELFRQNDAIISVVSLGECLSIMGQNKWGIKKKVQFYQAISHMGIIPVKQQDLVQAYADIDQYSQGKLASVDFTPRNMGKNDLWIAATAYVTNATLVTTDKDFDHLNERFIKVIYLDPLTLKTTF